MIKEIVERKLSYNKKQLQKFIDVGNKSAIRDYEVRCHILEDILEDADEANEVSPTDNNCNIQHVSNNEVAVDCVTCKHGDMMPDENPCFDCIDHSNWEQDTDC